MFIFLHSVFLLLCISLFVQNIQAKTVAVCHFDPLTKALEEAPNIIARIIVCAKVIQQQLLEVALAKDSDVEFAMVSSNYVKKIIDPLSLFFLLIHTQRHLIGRLFEEIFQEFEKKIPSGGVKEPSFLLSFIANQENNIEEYLYKRIKTEEQFVRLGEELKFFCEIILENLSDTAKKRYTDFLHSIKDVQK
jgi:hypothetical protein